MIFFFFLYTTDIFRTKTVIPRNINAFLRVNVTFYDAFNIIRDVITIPSPFPYTAKIMFVGVRNNETQIRR